MIQQQLRKGKTGCGSKGSFSSNLISKNIIRLRYSVRDTHFKIAALLLSNLFELNIPWDKFGFFVVLLLFLPREQRMETDTLSQVGGSCCLKKLGKGLAFGRKDFRINLERGVDSSSWEVNRWQCMLGVPGKASITRRGGWMKHFCIQVAGETGSWD